MTETLSKTELNGYCMSLDHKNLMIDDLSKIQFPLTANKTLFLIIIIFPNILSFSLTTLRAIYHPNCLLPFHKTNNNYFPVLAHCAALLSIQKVIAESVSFVTETRLFHVLVSLVFFSDSVFGL